MFPQTRVCVCKSINLEVGMIITFAVGHNPDALPRRRTLCGGKLMLKSTDLEKHSTSLGK